MTEWQPIETAPRDGTRFIGCLKSGRAITVFASRYYEKFPHQEGGPTFKTRLTEDRGDALFACESSVIAWMPLPEPPK